MDGMGSTMYCNTHVTVIMSLAVCVTPSDSTGAVVSLLSSTPRAQMPAKLKIHIFCGLPGKIHICPILLLHCHIPHNCNHAHVAYGELCAMEHNLKRARKMISGQPGSHTLTVWYKDVHSSRSQQANQSAPQGQCKQGQCTQATVCAACHTHHLTAGAAHRVTHNLCPPSTRGVDCHTPRRA